ncbi:MAG: pimeloyl-CoA dehydrogenase large subunit [Herminiimonas sp.]|nr:pimeloyl-CoA dehydrogenase large subunit [Herminiimonas sp.]MDB5852713.1 pimeloyl-CoA dehydrogenase large subunit [Herminiimonas sp.]
MDLNYSTEELEFRDQVRAWLNVNLPPALKARVASYAHLSKEETMGWHRILAAKGWIAPSWPVEWGGTGWNPVQRFIFEEECGYAGAPQLPALGLLMCAPVLIRYGSQAQKERFLPPLYRGEEFWCQGYSEPGAGSDLASLKTRAIRDGEDYVVTGQKAWTTQAHWADWMFCLVRTSVGERQQEGISFLLIDMKSPGVTVRPVMLMDGGHEVNEVFLDEVRVPVANLVHHEGQGWTVAKFLLGYERLNSGRIAPSKRQLARLKAMAAATTDQGVPLLDQPRFGDRLTQVEVELMALEITNLRFLDQMRRTGQPPGPEVSMLKLKGCMIQQALSELMLQVAGPQAYEAYVEEGAYSDAGERERLLAAIASRYLNLRKVTIYGGSDEIQRNILAKASLGL